MEHEFNKTVWAAGCVSGADRVAREGLTLISLLAWLHIDIALALVEW
jgi:hypothetical protein